MSTMRSFLPGRNTGALAIVGVVVWSWFFVMTAEAADANVTPKYFDRSIQPILKKYCYPCHSSEKHKGDFDMESFSSLAEIKRHPKIWQGVTEQLANNEMPPAEKPQPSAEEKTRLTDWVAAVLAQIGRERAGDPGPVVLRRLSNAEYTYTVRDLTGVETLDPAREFPVDGAAGEGFMNTGQALVMSPGLITKYLDAGKEIAQHIVLLPDGFRFSPKTTRRDWTDEILGEIREFYRNFTDSKGGEKVNLQGIVFETNEGGRLPVEKYIAATLAQRQALKKGATSRLAPGAGPGLNQKYLRDLEKMLNDKEPTLLGSSLLLDGLRAQWRSAEPGDANKLALEIAQWQKALWRFNTVGHIGKVGGPKSWMEPLSPIVAKQEVRVKIPAASKTGESSIYLVAGDAGDGNENDFVLWERPRLVAPGRPDLLLKDIRHVTRAFLGQRAEVFAHTAQFLAAASEAEANLADAPQLAAKHSVDQQALTAWLNFLGIGAILKIDSHFTNKLTKVSNYDFINGWGSAETPSLMANSSDEMVRIPGTMKPHSVAVHPSPKLQAAVGWQCPADRVLGVEAMVTHAHPECGNGVTWSLELRRGATRQRLGAGTTQGDKEVKMGPFEKLSLHAGDLVSLLIGPRDGNHACDLTAVNLVLRSAGENPQVWNLAEDVSADVLAANPHRDHFGNEGVWHFYTDPDNNDGSGPVIPAGSLLAKWQSAAPGDKPALAAELQKLLLSGAPTAKESPDAQLYRQLASFRGPLFSGMGKATSVVTPASGETNLWGLEPARFGHHPNGEAREAASLCVRAPSIIEVKLPAELAEGCEFVTTGMLDAATGQEGSVQLQVLTAPPDKQQGLLPSTVTQTQANGPWTADNRQISYAAPMLVNEGSQARKRIEAAFDDFRRWFPPALCYPKIVPVDEPVTLTLFYREDDQLARLMLDAPQREKLDRLWDELHYVSQDALTLVDALEQILQFATQDADPKVFEPMRGPIQERAAAFRRRLVETEPVHLKALTAFSRRAYRRPVTDAEAQELKELYQKLRDQGLAHEEAIRLGLARVLVAPAFLYRAETPGPGKSPAPLNDWELANRLSYFLWSSMPDVELAAAAEAGTLHQPRVLAAQTKRLLANGRTRRLAVEFACQWLHVRDFDTLDEKSERHFPTFNELRGPMYEETIQFFTDLFQNNGSVLSILDSDQTFLNETLAKHYGVPDVTGAEFRKVSGMKKFSRSGVLGQATILAKQSGASRTSPILRGNWVAEVLLGDKLPRPPKDVPKLPEDEALENLTVRQLTEKHTSDPRCYGCHKRIDAFGFALEEFDAIGRFRKTDLASHPIDVQAKVMDGTELEGSDGLRNYLLTKRRADFLRQFNRKLLGYALGRSIQLSDESLLSEMRARLEKDDFRVGSAIETIVRSRQFCDIRGRQAVNDD